MKIKVVKGSLKDREFVIEPEQVDEDKGILINGRAYSVYLQKGNYIIIEDYDKR